MIYSFAVQTYNPIYCLPRWFFLYAVNAYHTGAPDPVSWCSKFSLSRPCPYDFCLRFMGLVSLSLFLTKKTPNNTKSIKGIQTKTVGLQQYILT